MNRTNTVKRITANWNSPVPLPAAAGPSRGARKNAPLPGPSPALMVAPSAITSDFFGHLELRISDLPRGAAAKIERFQINNTNGVIDAAAVLQASYLVTDGQWPILKGITNTTIVADATPADGTIRTRLEYLDPFVQNMAGEYILRVSSPSGEFSPALQRLTVAPVSHPQQFGGRVQAGDSAVPFAYVGLIKATGAGGEFAGGAIADASGNYSIQAPVGAYDLIAARPGFVGQLGRSTTARLHANTNQIVNLKLQPGTRKISGRLFDLGQPERGLAGIQVFGWTADNARFTIAYTDADGNWSLSVTPDVWRISILPQAVVSAGYVALEEVYLDAEAGDLLEVNIGLPRATRFVRGTVRDVTDNSPVSDCAVELWSIDLDYRVRVRSDAQGQYLAPVFEGQWLQYVNPESAMEEGFAGTRAIQLNVSSDPVLESNLFLDPLEVELAGAVVDDLGKPVPGVILLFRPAGDTDRFWTTGESDEAGRISSAVPEGILRASVDMPNTYYDLIEVEPPPFQARPDETIELKLLVKRPTSRLQVRVVDNWGRPVTDLPLFAEARLATALHRTFDYTDDKGVADLGVIPGEWTVRFDQTNVALSLDTYGYSPATNRLVSITGSDQTIEVMLTPLPGTEPPKLSVAAAGSRIRLNWPASTGTQSFGLQSAPSLGGPWTNVSVTPAVTGQWLGVEVEPSSPAGFFRLRRP